MQQSILRRPLSSIVPLPSNSNNAMQQACRSSRFPAQHATQTRTRTTRKRPPSSNYDPAMSSDAQTGRGSATSGTTQVKMFGTLLGDLRGPLLRTCLLTSKRPCPQLRMTYERRWCYGHAVYGDRFNAMRHWPQRRLERRGINDRPSPLDPAEGAPVAWHWPRRRNW